MKEKLKNKKTIAIIKVILWLVFMAVIIGVLFYEKNKVEQYQKEYIKKNTFVVDFNYLKTSLLNNDFKYLYIIVDDGIISYEGNRVKGKYTGIYKKENTKTDYNDLSILNKQYPFLSLDRIFAYFDGDFTKTNNTFLYENDKLYVKIRVSIDNIVNIEVNDDNIIYQLEISNINGFDVKGRE